MPYAVGPRSKTALVGVHPKMAAVFTRALAILSRTGGPDAMVLEGVRSPERQKKLYAQGRTAPGKVVTWTLKSNHFVNPLTGYGHAIDVLPAPYDWKLEDPKSTPEIDDAFAKVAKAMYQAADELTRETGQSHAIRWGANWDGDRQWREKGETDNPHFELAAGVR